jgi:hypothetical protein
MPDKPNIRVMWGDDIGIANPTTTGASPDR